MRANYPAAKKEGIPEVCNNDPLIQLNDMFGMETMLSNLHNAVYDLSRSMAAGDPSRNEITLQSIDTLQGIIKVLSMPVSVK